MMISAGPGLRALTLRCRARLIAGGGAHRRRIQEPMKPELGQNSAHLSASGCGRGRRGGRRLEVCGGEGVCAGADLDGPLAAGGAHELPDRPAGGLFDPAADGRGGEHDGQVRFDGVALAVVDGRACRSCMDIRNDFSGPCGGCTWTGRALQRFHRARENRDQSKDQPRSECPQFAGNSGHHHCTVTRLRESPGLGLGRLCRGAHICHSLYRSHRTLRRPLSTGS